jgi:SAM-dependent methyltransferase
MPTLCEIFFELLHGDDEMYYSDDEEDCYPVEEIVLDQACGELLLDYAQIPNILMQKHIASIVSLGLLCSDDVLFSIAKFVTSQWDQALLVAKADHIDKTLFLNVSISAHPTYPELLRRVRDENHRLLDVGCSLGQNLRKLAYDGVDTRNLQGLELKLGLTELGFDLFQDGDRFRGSFSAGNILSHVDIPGLSDGSFDMVHAGLLLDRLDEYEQARALKKMIMLLKPRRGSFVLGQQCQIETCIKTDELARRDSKSDDSRSFREVVRMVEIEMDTEFEVQTEVDQKVTLESPAVVTTYSYFTISLR